MAELTISADDIQGAIASYVSSFEADTGREEIGTVIDAGDGIAHVEGLPSAMTQELLEFSGGVLGVALNLDEHSIGAVILGEFDKIEQGMQVKRTGEVLSVPVGDAFMGRVVNPLGEPIDGRGDIAASTRRAPLTRNHGNSLGNAVKTVRALSGGRAEASAARGKGLRSPDAPPKKYPPLPSHAAAVTTPPPAATDRLPHGASYSAHPPRAESQAAIPKRAASAGRTSPPAASCRSSGSTVSSRCESWPHPSKGAAGRPQ